MGDSGQGRRASVVAAMVLVALVLAAFAALAPATSLAQSPEQLAPVVVDGPATPGAGPTGLAGSVARDGTGGLVYLKPAGGTERVYLSGLTGGTFAPPVAIDGSLGGAAAQPVVAAGSGGALVVAFLHGGSLYVTERANALAPFRAPRLIATGAAAPALAMSSFGKAYLAYTVADGGGSDVRVAFYGAGRWMLAGAPLNRTRADDAGTGADRPAVAAAGDGVGIVAWGEGGHVDVRRVWGAAPSVVTLVPDGPVGGCGELGADEPAIGAGGDSSYATVTWHEDVDCGGQVRSDVLANRLHGSRLGGMWAADGPISGAADRPALAIGEYGTGWITAEQQAPANALSAEQIVSTDLGGQTEQVNALPGATRPFAVPAMAGLYSTVIAWQHDPGAGAPPEIRARYAWANQVLEPEIVLSAAAQGPTNAAAGLTAGGDIAGDAVVAWVQSTAAGDELVADELVAPPLPASPVLLPGFTHTRRVRLSWGAATEPWGPVSYTVTIDGAVVGQTSATSLIVPTPAVQGPNTWAVTVTNQRGLSSGPAAESFFVDTLAPQLTARLSGARVAGRTLQLRVRASDVSATVPGPDASGLASITVKWGDGSVQVISRRHPWAHVYNHPGRYRLTVVATDRAGNVSKLIMHVRVARPPRPRQHPATRPPGK